MLVTQQQMSKLLDISDRTLRDWKKSRQRLYKLLESIDYNEAKKKINGVDVNDVIDFDPSIYSHNLFWQTNQKSKQKVYSIISKYLSSMNANNIKILCKQFGKNLVKSVLKDKYKKMYAKGFISTNGMDIPLSGTFENNEMYKKLLGIINDC
jgi:hemerythrin-like domain-containing protein